MNTYTTEFFAKCPVNGIRIRYHLTIEARATILVEAILRAIENVAEGFHEEIADRLAPLGGRQTLVADHHGVSIKTIRGDAGTSRY